MYLNDLIRLCNLFSIVKEGYLVDLATRLINYLSDLNLLQSNILQNERDTESETDFNSNNTGNTQNDTSLASTLSNITELSHSNNHK